MSKDVSELVSEITQKEIRFFETIPGNNVLVNVNSPRFTILAVTESYLSETGKKRHDLIGRGMFEVFPANPADPTDTGENDLRHSFNEVIAHKKIHSLPTQRYDVANKDGSFEERYWHASNTPFLDDEDVVKFIIHSAVEITSQVKAKKREEEIKGIKQAHNLFLQAPVAIHIFKGDDLIVELANKQTLTLWGKSNEVIGKPLEDALPEIKGQGFSELLKRVRETGTPYETWEAPVQLLRNGSKEQVYVNLAFQPYYEEDKEKAIGVLVIASEVTEQVTARKKVKESEHKFQNVVEQANYAISILMGADMIIEVANEPLLRIWDRGKEVIGQKVKDVIPEAEEQGFLELLLDVYHNGKTHYGYETAALMRRRNSEPQVLYFDFVYQPYRNLDGEIIGVLVLANDITERVNTKKELAVKNQSLKESSEKFSNLLEALPQMTWTNLPGGEVNFYNQKWYTYTGLDYEQTKEWGWKAIVHPDDLPGTLKDFLEALETGNVFENENRYRRADGEYRWHLNRALPFKNDKGEIILWVGTATDIHDLKQTKNALEESEQQVRSLVESAPFPIGVYVGREMRITLANQTIMDVWGKGNNVVGKLYSEVLPELDNQNIYQQLDAVFMTGIAYHAKNQRVDLLVDGKLQSYYFNYSFTPLFDASGNVYGVMNTAAEITDLIVANQKVQESQRNLHNMILQAPVAMCILKGSEYIVDIANERMFEIWGKSSKELLKKPIFEGLPEAKEQGLESLLYNVYTTGETFNAFEMPVDLPRNGKIERTYLNFVYEPFYETEGVIIGIMAVAIDVTEQVMARRKIEEVVTQRTKELAQANEALVRSNEELKRSNINLEEFAYAASHDLKEPIRKIHFFNDRLKVSLNGRLSEEETRFFERMETSAKRMGSLVDDLLSYSQVSLKPRVFEEVDLTQLVNTVLNDLDLEIHQKGAIIHLNELCVVPAHPRQLQQAFQNLITNSLKYAKPGVAPEINISCYQQQGAQTELPMDGKRSEKDFWVIEIADNGIGFNQRDADRIFNVFTRLHGNIEYKGTGVGLSIVRKVIENHNGFITAFSEPGEGATFKLYFPNFSN